MAASVRLIARHAQIGAPYRRRRRLANVAVVADARACILHTNAAALCLPRIETATVEANEKASIAAHQYLPCTTSKKPRHRRAKLRSVQLVARHLRHSTASAQDAADRRKLPLNKIIHSSKNRQTAISRPSSNSLARSASPRTTTKKCALILRRALAAHLIEFMPLAGRTTAAARARRRPFVQG